MAGHKDTIIDLAFSPDGSQVVTAGNDSTTRAWDTRTGEQRLLLYTPGHVADAVAFTPVVTVSHLAGMVRRRGRQAASRS